MPRNMSFALTTNQFKNRTKTVTRRFGWDFLKPGDIVCGVEKAMGLKKGDKIKKLGLIRILSIRREPLNVITPEDVAKEGFPDCSVEDFINMICSHYKCDSEININRIEFEYI